jgi:hypothetical protein
MNINDDPSTFCELVLYKCVRYKEVTAGTLSKCEDRFLHILVIRSRDVDQVIVWIFIANL